MRAEYYECIVQWEESITWHCSTRMSQSVWILRPRNHFCLKQKGGIMNNFSKSRNCWDGTISISLTLSAVFITHTSRKYWLSRSWFLENVDNETEWNLPVNIWIGDDEEGEAPLPVERSLVLERVRLVLGLIQALGHNLINVLISIVKVRARSRSGESQVKVRWKSGHSYHL